MIAMDSKRFVRFSVPLVGGLLSASLAIAAGADVQSLPQADLSDLSLEQLSNIEVTSVSKRPESIAEAPSSIYVITASDIRRSGAGSLPEALRLAPNLQVARVDARNYAVTARGFNNPFENKLLVLIDGRIVYSPLFSGVYWDAQDVVLEDVERIEVISGPGATLWGANAVNGVINIITTSAGLTQGALASATLGGGQHTSLARFGGKLGEAGFFRVYAKHASADSSELSSGAQTLTGWDRDQAGFRADFGNSAKNLTVQGDAYHGDLQQRGTRDIFIGGQNLLSRLNYTLDDGSMLSLLAYWDQTRRDQPNAFVERLDTFHLQVQHAVRSGAHSIVWGGSYRQARDRVTNGPAFAFLPGRLDMHWSDLFVQDEITLRDDLRFTAGLKFESNNYTGTETLPTLRLAWKPEASTLLWTSLARTVRAPSRIDRDLYSPSVPRVVNGVPQYAIAGGPEFQSETANVLEFGYRAQFGAKLSGSATAFASDYGNLRTLEPNPHGAGSVFLNRASGRTHGIELWGAWQAAAAWRLSAGMVAQRVATSLDAGSKDATGTTGLATADPEHYASLRSSWDLARGHELDLMLRWVGRLPGPAVPAYTAVDLRYGWNIGRGLELSLVGRNLLDPKHGEFSAASGRSEYERALMLKLVWRP
jgi:iron complex outermembrane receptor protein